MGVMNLGQIEHWKCFGASSEPGTLDDGLLLSFVGASVTNLVLGGSFEANLNVGSELVALLGGGLDALSGDSEAALDGDCELGSALEGNTTLAGVDLAANDGTLQ